MRTLSERLTSRKFIMTIAAAVLAFIGAFIPDLPVESIIVIVGALMGYVAIEGIVDAAGALGYWMAQRREQDKETKD